MRLGVRQESPIQTSKSSSRKGRS